MDVRILLIDDDATICEQVKTLLNDEIIGGHNINLEYLTNFDDAKKALSEKDYDLIVLDLFRGRPAENNNDRPGEIVLDEIKKSCFIPVIFFIGLVKPVEHLQSDIVRVLRKTDGVERLKVEISAILDSGLPFIKKKLNGYVRETVRGYFWDFVHPNWKIFRNITDEISLGYLIVRRLANSLSKERIKEMLGDSRISPDSVHPMEFYIFPPTQQEYEFGDILKKDNIFYVILTPSCDFILRDVKRAGQSLKERKATKILLCECSPLSETDEYKKFKQTSEPGKDVTESITKLIKNNRSDRYFFIPIAPFIPNSVIDYQKIIVVPQYDNLKNYEKLAKLDAPFSQSMQASFIRYYNRIGHPDIDVDCILKSL